MDSKTKKLALIGAAVVAVALVLQAPDFGRPERLRAAPFVGKTSTVLKAVLYDVCRAKVGNLERTAFCEHQILRLDVAVGNAELVQVLQAKQQLLEQAALLVERHGRALVQQIEQIATRALQIHSS